MGFTVVIKLAYRQKLHFKKALVKFEQIFKKKKMDHFFLSHLEEIMFKILKCMETGTKKDKKTVFCLVLLCSSSEGGLCYGFGLRRHC